LDVGIEPVASPEQRTTVGTSDIIDQPTRPDKLSPTPTLVQVSVTPSTVPSIPSPQATSSMVTPGPISWQERPPGLVFRTVDALWQIDGDEQPVTIGNFEAIISPDGTQLLSYDFAGQDIWLHDLTGGLSRQLTNMPERSECCFTWWPQRPDIVVFGSTAPDFEPQPGVMGSLTLATLDGETYQVLDADHDIGPSGFALSPDGQTIAYGGGETGWLYHMDAGLEPFDPSAYGLSGPKSIQLGSPAWSPDGMKLAWMVGGGLGQDGDYRMAIGVFDLEARTFSMLHPYEPMGRGGWPEAPVWSPDGNWLAIAAGPVNLDEAGVWVVHVNGQEEHRLGWGGTPVWSPDGRWLAFGHMSAEGVPGVAAAETATWELRPVSLPPGNAYLLDWIDLRP
jgi:Tol biopolymer transport system component